MRFLATCLLLIYISVSCRPIFPVLADGLAHLLWYQHHVETVHMHDGNAHVHSEIVEAASEPGEHGAAPVPAKSFKISDFLAAHIVVSFPYTPVICWKITTGRLFGNPVMMVGLYSLEVPVPPPDSDVISVNAIYHTPPVQTYVANVPYRSKGVYTFFNLLKTKTMPSS